METERRFILCPVGGQECENSLCIDRWDESRGLPCGHAVLAVVKLIEASALLKKTLGDGITLEALNNEISKISSEIAPKNLGIDPLTFNNVCLLLINTEIARREARLRNDKK